MAKPASTTGFLATGKRVAMETAKLLEGFVGGEIPADKHLNELFAKIEDWLAWINTDVVDITSAQTVGGAKTFSAAAVFSEIVTFAKTLTLRSKLIVGEPADKSALHIGPESREVLNVVLPDPSDAANAIETFERASVVNGLYVPGVSTPHIIRNADTGTDEFTISGDYTGLFAVGRTFDVSGSTGNDGGSPYTVTAVSLVDGDTVIGVASIASAVADGAINADPIAITGADTGADKFTVLGDVTGIFLAGRTFAVAGSTGNDGGSPYTVISSAVNGANTDIFVSVVADGTADGTIDADAEWQVLRDDGALVIDAISGSTHAKAIFYIPNGSNPGVGVSIPKSGAIWEVAQAVPYVGEVAYGELSRVSTQALANPSFIKVVGMADVEDEASLVNTTDDGLKAPTDGIYQIEVSAQLTVIAIDTQAKISLQNAAGSTTYATDTVTNGSEGAAATLEASISATLKLSKDDVVNLWAQNTGAGSGVGGVKFRVTRLRSFNP